MPKEFLGERMSYDRAGLERDHLTDDPFELLRTWLDEAQQADVIEPSAMGLSSVSADGRPSSRMVLLRALDRGLVFFTNYESRKGRELEGQGVASALFWWPTLERQLRVEGHIERVSEAESDAYFESRPRESQLASSASPQSQEVASREVIESIIRDLDVQHPGALPRPPNWGGYRMIPDRFEFWQGRPARLHDRFAYVLESGFWRISRLAP